MTFTGGKAGFFVTAGGFVATGALVTRGDGPLVATGLHNYKLNELYLQPTAKTYFCVSSGGKYVGA